MSKRRRRKRKHSLGPKSDRAFRTQEGDPVALAVARYTHNDLKAVRKALEAAADFKASGSDGYLWLGEDAKQMLASMTLNEKTIEVDALSEQRREECCGRLEAVLEGIEIGRVEIDESIAALTREALTRGLIAGAGDLEDSAVPQELIDDLQDLLLGRWLEE